MCGLIRRILEFERDVRMLLRIFLCQILIVGCSQRPEGELDFLCGLGSFFRIACLFAALPGDSAELLPLPPPPPHAASVNTMMTLQEQQAP